MRGCHCVSFIHTQHHVLNKQLYLWSGVKNSISNRKHGSLNWWREGKKTGCDSHPVQTVGSKKHTVGFDGASFYFIGVWWLFKDRWAKVRECHVAKVLGLELATQRHFVFVYWAKEDFTVERCGWEPSSLPCEGSRYTWKQFLHFCSATGAVAHKWTKHTVFIKNLTLHSVFI